VSADDVSIVQGPRGIESIKYRSGPARSERNRRRRLRFQVAQARSDGEEQALEGSFPGGLGTSRWVALARPSQVRFDVVARVRV
jgi:hypothetical protein